MTARIVWAAGGVVWRPAVNEREIVLVHRPRYDDWSLPKGKQSPGEHPLVCAVREVFEETAVHAVPQLSLPSTRYLTGDPGVEKAVRYWSMRLVEAEMFVPGDEVDDVRWFDVPEAARQLTYGHDRGVVKAFAEGPSVTAMVILVRHASAGRRSTWSGPDEQRPLDAAGQADAEALAGVLAVFRPDRLLPATPLRCTQTLGPLAERLDVSLDVDPRFDETADPSAAVAAVRQLADAGGTSVVCSQGGLVPVLLAALNGSSDPKKYSTPKANGWTLAFGRNGLIAADRMELHPRLDS